MRCQAATAAVCAVEGCSEITRNADRHCHRHRRLARGVVRESVVGGGICALCQKRAYATEATTDSCGRTFHRACLKCLGCGRQLGGTSAIPFEIVGTGNRAVIYCNAPSDPHSCYSRLSEQQARMGTTANLASPKRRARSFVRATLAGTKVAVDREEHGDITGVLEVIGAELEAALDGLVPRCDICGATFDATDVVLVRDHAEGGRAGGEGGR